MFLAAFPKSVPHPTSKWPKFMGPQTGRQIMWWPPKSHWRDHTNCSKHPRMASRFAVWHFTIISWSLVRLALSAVTRGSRIGSRKSRGKSDCRRAPKCRVNRMTSIAFGWTRRTAFCTLDAVTTTFICWPSKMDRCCDRLAATPTTCTGSMVAMTKTCIRHRKTEA